MATILQEWLEDLKRNLFRRGAEGAEIGTRFAEVRASFAQQGAGGTTAFVAEPAESEAVDDGECFSSDPEIEDAAVEGFADIDWSPGFTEEMAEPSEPEQPEPERAADEADPEGRGVLSALAVPGERRPAIFEEAPRQESEDDWSPHQDRSGPLSRNAPPEESELKRKRAKFSELEAQLTERELAATNLRSELSAIKARYLKSVGPRLADLDETEARIAELHARSRPLDAEAQREARRARRQAERSRAAVQQSTSAPPSPPSPVLKRLYREVAKRIHPDLGVGPADRAVRAQLMAQANRAFLVRNEARLRAIVEDYESSPETVSGEDTASELVRIIRRTARVKRRLVDIDRGMQHLQQSELCRLKVRMAEKAKQGSDLLEEMARRVDERISRARKRLSDLREDLGPEEN